MKFSKNRKIEKKLIHVPSSVPLVFLKLNNEEKKIQSHTKVIRNIKFIQPKFHSINY